MITNKNKTIKKNEKPASVFFHRKMKTKNNFAPKIGWRALAE